MRKTILGILVLVALLGAQRMQIADLGVSYLKNKYNADISANTVTTADTLFTAVYAVDAVRGMSSYTSMFIKLDSLRDSIATVVKLQESYDDGATWEYTTTVCSVRTNAAALDTAFDVDLFPAPFFRFLIIGLATNDSFTVEDAIFYNHPGSR